MKKIANKFSKIAINCLAAIATLLVAFLGVFSAPLMNVARVMADEAFSSSTLSLAKLKSKVKLGNDIEIPKGTTDDGQVNIVVKDPKNKVVFDSTRAGDFANVTDAGTKYTLKADKVGTYKIQYSVKGASSHKELQTQEFKVVVTGEKAQLSFETNSKYMIPSVVNAEHQIVLPNPIVKDSEGNDVKEAKVLESLKVVVKETATGTEYSSDLANTDYFIKKVDARKDADNNDVYNYAFTPSGDVDCSYIVTYYYTDTLTGLETVYKPFEINYEKEFKASDIKFGYKFVSDGEGLSSIPSSLELGEEVILPIANFYDENDEDFSLVGVTDVQVIFTPNAANKEKYASLLESGKDYVVVSNSNKFTPMYSSNEGYYTINYDLSSFYTYAENSKKVAGEEKKTDAHLVYNITDAKDSTAPTTYVVNDYAESEINGTYEPVDVSYLIPTKVKTGTTVNFPAIFATDNVSSFEDMKNSFHRVIVPEKEANTTLENETKSGTNDKYKFNETASFTFDKAGTYTVRYEATDKANRYNYTGTTFKIEVVDEFEDNAAPRITMSTVPAVVEVGETLEINKPQIIDYKSTDAQETEVVDKNLEVYYFYYLDSAIADADALKAEIETYRTTKTSLNLKLLEEKEGDNSKLALTIPNASKVTVVAVAIDDSHYIDSEKGLSVETRTINVLNVENDSDAPVINTVDSEYKAGLEANTLKQDEVIKLPELKAADGTYTDYLKASVEVVDKNGNSVSVVNAKYEVNGSNYVIKDAKFVATKSGYYTIVYRLSDLGGNYTIKSYVVSIARTKAPTIEIDGTVTSAEIGEAIKLPAAVVKEDGEVVSSYKISVVFGDDVPSNKFVVGTNEFTALEAGTFTYKYVAKDGDTVVAETGFYSFEAKDTQKPVITTDYDLNSIKTFKLVKEEGATDYNPIELPGYTAEDVLNGIRESKVTVKSPSGKELKVTYDEENGVYKFIPTLDGAYTVVYSATDNANNTTELTYVIKVGDTTAPSISFAEISDFGKRADIKVNGSLTLDLDKIKVSDAGTTETAKALTTKYTNGNLKRFLITVTGPDGSTVTAEDDSYEYVLKTAGKYTITYTARDQAGNEKIVKEYVTVYADNNASVISTETWSIVLIVLSLAILAGVIIYFVKTRDKKTDKKTPVKLTDDKKDDKKED